MCYLSDKKMKEEGFNTVECLRGRLLAERHASKLANEEAESLAHKLIELENKLREEIKLREKAERRLYFLKKKLKSLHISSASGESEQSNSSEKCENSFTTSSSVSTDAEESKTKPHSTNSSISESSIHQVSTDSEPFQTQNDDSVSKEYPWENPSPNAKDFKNNESRLSISSSKSSTKDSIAQDTDNYSSNTSPSDSSPKDSSHNPIMSSNKVKNNENQRETCGLQGKNKANERAVFNAR